MAANPGNEQQPEEGSNFYTAVCNPIILYSIFCFVRVEAFVIIAAPLVVCSAENVTSRSVTMAVVSKPTTC